MAEYEKKVRDKLSEYGCYFVRHGKGDHDVWYSPITKRHVTVDGNPGNGGKSSPVLQPTLY